MGNEFVNYLNSMNNASGDNINALAEAHAVDAAVPLTGLVMEMMQSLKADGCVKEDHSALIKFYEKIRATFLFINKNITPLLISHKLLSTIIQYFH